MGMIWELDLEQPHKRQYKELDGYLYILYTNYYGYNLGKFEEYMDINKAHVSLHESPSGKKNVLFGSIITHHVECNDKIWYQIHSLYIRQELINEINEIDMINNINKLWVINKIPNYPIRKRCEICSIYIEYSPVCEECLVYLTTRFIIKNTPIMMLMREICQVYIIDDIYSNIIEKFLDIHS
jgi:hypothetical protein